MAYDTKCHDLAEYFLAADCMPAGNPVRHKNDLAQTIQDAIEAWLARDGAPHAPSLLLATARTLRALLTYHLDPVGTIDARDAADLLAGMDDALRPFQGATSAGNDECSAPFNGGGS